MRLGAILALAFVLRLAVVLWLSDTVPFTDYAHYDLAGRKLAENWGFFFDRSQVEYYGSLGWWPPLYSFCLGALYSILGPHFRTAVFVQVLIGTGVCWFVYRIGRRASGETVGLVAAALVAIDPTYIFATNLLASENLFALLFVLGLWLVGRSWRTARGYAVAGFVFGLGALTRAIGLLVPVVAALWLRRRAPNRRAWLIAVAWLLGATALPIAPWTLRNALVAGSPALVCFGGGLNFYYGHNAVCIGYRDWKQTPMGQEQTQAAIDRLGYRLGLQYLAQRPFGFCTRAVPKIGALFGVPRYAPHDNSAILMPENWQSDPEQARRGEELRARQRAKNRDLDGVFTVLGAIHSDAILIGALLACLLFWRQLPADLRLGVWLSLYWIAAHVVFWAQPRFRYPMEIPLALLSAYALSQWLARRAAHTAKSVSPPAMSRGRTRRTS